jgi:hypothetical protein
MLSSKASLREPNFAGPLYCDSKLPFEEALATHGRRKALARPVTVAARRISLARANQITNQDALVLVLSIGGEVVQGLDLVHGRAKGQDEALFMSVLQLRTWDDEMPAGSLQAHGHCHSPDDDLGSIPEVHLIGCIDGRPHGTITS